MMQQKKKVRLAGLVLVLLMLGGLFWDAYHRFPMVNTVLTTLTRPLSFVVSGFSGGVRGIGPYFASKASLENENKALQKENEELRQSNVELAGIKAENERLAKLLHFSELHPQWEMLSAKVISRDLGDFRDVILLDKGTSDGLRMNMPVVNAFGLIGIIDGVYPHMSKVLLISSPRSRIRGLNLRGASRAAGIVSGVAGPDLLLEMRDLSRGADVLPGDTIVTSGYSGYHPEGLVIGTVEDVQMDAGGLTKTATIAPAVDYSHLEEARVITNFQGFADFLQKEGKDTDAGGGDS